MKKSKVPGKVKAGKKRIDRMLALDIPAPVKGFLKTAGESLAAASEWYEKEKVNGK